MRAGRFGALVVVFAALVGGAGMSSENGGPDARASEAARQAARTPWTDGRRVLPRTVRTGLTDLEFDASGTAYLAVSGSGQRHPGAGFYDYDSLQIPRILIRKPGEARFGRPQKLSTQKAGELELAVAANGAAVALWGIENGIQYAIRNPGEPFGRPITDKRLTDYSYGLDVGIADDGSALITWGDYRDRAHALYRSGLGPFRPVPGFRARDPEDVLGAVNARGDMSLVWDMEGRRRMRLRQSSRPAGGRWSAPRRPTGFRDELPLHYYGASLAISEAGESLFAEDRRYAICPLTGPCTDARDLRSARSAPWGKVDFLADSLGRIHAIWQRYLGQRRGGFQILDAVRREGGSFSSPRVVTLQRDFYLVGYAVGPAGTILVGYNAAPGGNHRKDAIFTSTFIPGSGWGHSQRASPVFRDCLLCRRYSSHMAHSFALGAGGHSLAAWAISRWDQPVPSGALLSERPPSTRSGPRRGGFPSSR